MIKNGLKGTVKFKKVKIFLNNYFKNPKIYVILQLSMNRLTTNELGAA